MGDVVYVPVVPVVRLCGALVVGPGVGALGPRDLGGAKVWHVLLALLARPMLPGPDPGRRRTLPSSHPARDRARQSGNGLTTRPSTASSLTAPRSRESTELARASPMTKTASCGTV